MQQVRWCEAWHAHTANEFAKMRLMGGSPVVRLETSGGDLLTRGLGHQLSRRTQRSQAVPQR